MSLFRRGSPDAGRWIVFGLGNPGERYERTSQRRRDGRVGSSSTARGPRSSVISPAR